MNRRVSVAEQLLEKKDSRAYLSVTSENVCIIVLKGNNINFGKQLFLEKNSTIIICAKSNKSLVVSISRYEGKFEFKEFFYSFCPLSQISDLMEDVPCEYLPFIGASIKKLDVRPRQKNDEYAVR